MKLIVITSEKWLPKESITINQLFESGLETLHLRKPSGSLNEIKKLLGSININCHSRIVLHDHFNLTELFNLKGIHLNKRNPEIYPKPNLTYSRSCHSLEEITTSAGYDYVFLSPIFDSISKAGYHKSFTTDQLKNAKTSGIINSLVMALGGVTLENIPIVKEYGFGGIAVLGDLWIDYEKDNNITHLLKRFNKLKTKCEEL